MQFVSSKNICIKHSRNLLADIPRLSRRNSTLKLTSLRMSSISKHLESQKNDKKIREFLVNFLPHLFFAHRKLISNWHRKVCAMKIFQFFSDFGFSDSSSWSFPFLDSFWSKFVTDWVFRFFQRWPMIYNRIWINTTSSFNRYGTTYFFKFRVFLNSKYSVTVCFI